MDPDTDHAEAHFIRDAMGHHASHYKAALQTGNKNLANEHAKEFIKLGHLAHKIERIDPSKLKFDTVDLQPWQATRPDLFADPHKTSGVDLTGWRSHKKMKGNKDYSWLQNPPHESRAVEIFKKPSKTTTKEDGTVEHEFHNGAFPMEHVRINGKHIPIEDVDVSHGFFTPHPFDSHPVMDVFDDSASKHSPEDASRYQDKLSKFHDSEEGQYLMAKLGDLLSPEHGAQPGSPVHPPVANPLQKPVNQHSGRGMTVDQHREEMSKETNDILSELGIDPGAEETPSSSGLVIRRRQE